MVRQDRISRKVHGLQRVYNLYLFTYSNYRNLEDTLVGRFHDCVVDQPLRRPLGKEMQELQLNFVFCFENEYSGTLSSTE
jgi:hypothetical protein